MTLLENTKSTGRAGRAGRRRPRVLSSFETAPAFLFYLPVAAWWTALSLRYLSFTLPSASNPAIRAGGLCGESKSAVLGLLGAHGKTMMAGFATVDLAPGATPADNGARVQAAMTSTGLDFPVVVKPDVGRNGRGVRKIADAQALAAYLAEFPTDMRLMVQDFVPWKGEAGIFYIRAPGEEKGRITSVTLKYFPSVTGDGHASLRELILADPRAGLVPQFYLPRLAGQLDDIVPKGQEFPLVFTGNHCQGAIFRDGGQHVTPALLAEVEKIAQEIDGFYFGRFDIRYDSLDALKQGRDFRIIELNGAGSEATHIWDANMTLMGAYKALFHQVYQAFRIGAINRRRGTRPMGPIRLLRLFYSEKAEMRRYPSQQARNMPNTAPANVPPGG